MRYERKCGVAGSILLRASVAWMGFLGSLVCLCFSTSALADLVKLDTKAPFNSVYLFKDANSPVITVGLTVLAGEVDVEGPEGLSHYLEHLMYWHADELDGQKIHARGGNAWVNGILTSYYNESERSDLDDMLEFIHRLFSEPGLDRGFMLQERSVVEREYDYRVSENPDRRVYTSIRRDLYNDLPVSRSVIGTPQSIRSLTLQQASSFHQRFYHPANSVIFLAGNLAESEAVAIIEKRFSVIDSGQRHDAEWRDAIIEESSDNVTEHSNSQVNYERLIYLTLCEWPDKNDPVLNWYALELLRAALDSALEGGIARPLRMNNFVLRNFVIDFESVLSNYFEMTLFAEPDKGVTLPQSSEAIEATFKQIATSGIPQATLERVKTRMLQTENRHANIMLENYHRFARQLNSDLAPLNTDQHLKNIEAVTLEQINELAGALAKPRRRSIAFIKPAGE